MFFSNACWPQLLAPLEILMSKISLKYFAIHIYIFLAHHGDQNHEIVQPWIPQDYKYEEHKGQIPLIIHHKE